MSGDVVVFEGDEQSGVVAAGDTRSETGLLMRQAMTEHIAMLRDLGETVPQPTSRFDATVLDIPAA